MHGYRDHSLRKAYSSKPTYYSCPMYQLLSSYYGYRQKAEEYPAYHHKQPKNPPPNYTPKIPTSVSSIEYNIISPCVYKYTYLWLKNGESFWSYIVYVGKRAVSGWRYKRGRWIHFSSHLKQIKNFTCS